MLLHHCTVSEAFKICLHVAFKPSSLPKGQPSAFVTAWCYSEEVSSELCCLIVLVGTLAWYN